MADLIRSYGHGLTAVFILLTAIWAGGLIVLPQVSMLERAFTVEDRGGASAQIAIEIDRAYTRQFQLDQELHQLQGAGSAASGSQPGAPSPFAPTINTGQAKPAADAAARIGELEAERAALVQQIAALEQKERALGGEIALDTHYSLGNFTSMSAVHFQIFLSTLIYALCVTLLSFVVCYPVAFAAATTKESNKLAIMLLLLIIPYAINELLRIFSWVMILEKQGLLNALFDAAGVIDMSAGEGFRFVASNGAVVLVMVYAYVLFMVFPIYNTIDTLDPNQIEAARDLGASTWRIHTRVVMPHAKPGIAVGSIMTFMLSAGSIAAPEIVGRGLHPDWFSQVIYRRFFEADSWNQGSAYSVALLAACIGFILLTMTLFRVGIRDIAR